MEKSHVPAGQTLRKAIYPWLSFHEEKCWRGQCVWCCAFQNEVRQENCSLSSVPKFECCFGDVQQVGKSFSVRGKSLQGIKCPLWIAVFFPSHFLWSPGAGGQPFFWTWPYPMMCCRLLNSPLQPCNSFQANTMMWELSFKTEREIRASSRQFWWPPFLPKK